MTKLVIQTSVLGDSGVRVGKLAARSGLDGDATIQEAIDHGYINGHKAEAMKGLAQGLFRSAIRGIERDGNGRALDGHLSLNAFARGLLDDICDDPDPKTARATVRALLLKKVRDAFDPSGFVCVIEGSTGSFTIESITSGEEMGVVKAGLDVFINGGELVLREGDGVKWSVNGESGTVDAAYLASTPNRITVDKDGLADLAAAATAGDTVVFELRIGGKVGTKAVTWAAND